MPLQATSGAASYDAFGGGVPVVPAYIEEVFSTYLYTGNGNTAPETQTINNGIDLSTNGGLVWIKNRTVATNNVLFDTNRGATKVLVSNATSAEATDASTLTSFNNNGFSVYYGQGVNGQNNPIASWTFRKQPKFFDVVTYTGNGSARTIAHNLGSVPGCIIVKCTNQLTSWAVYHRSLGGTYLTRLNTDGASETGYENWANTDPTSTVFTVGNGNATNGVDFTYVAYVFAHNAGGFGLTGTDNVISCGTYTGSGGVDTITLGYEPQWVLLKGSSTSSPWILMDVMREMSNTDNRYLTPNTSDAEGSYGFAYVRPTSTGFTVQPGYYGTGASVIYIAIRRGPMKVPTSGTKVFSPNTANASAGTAIVTNFPVDLSIAQARSAGDPARWEDRLRGVNSPNLSGATPTLRSDSTAAETTASITLGWDNTQIQVPSYYASVDSIWWNFRRAPSFFDEVCYTGTNVNNQAFTHNLGAVPELMIIKMRVFSSGTGFWFVYSSTLGYTNYLLLNSTDASASAGIFGSQNPDSSSFYVSGGANINSTASQYVAYLFATCAGVSKVFSYTGNGSSQTINCGFTGGARWILIKRTDSTGDWYCWDSARGIVSGNDPHLSLNTTAAEVTSDDTIDTDSTGFVVNQVAATNVNVSSATYIGLAIA
jgi:hypothetical protein